MTIQNPPPTLETGEGGNWLCGEWIWGGWLVTGCTSAPPASSFTSQRAHSLLPSALCPETCLSVTPPRFPGLSRLPLSLPPADSSKKHFSKAMRELVAKCLVKDPTKRPTAAQVSARARMCAWGFRGCTHVADASHMLLSIH